DRPRDPGALYVMPIFGLLAASIAAVMLGNARAAVADLVALAAKKSPQGSRRTLAERATAQSELAQAQARLHGAWAFLVEAVEAAWHEAKSNAEIKLATRAALRLAATHGTRTAAEVCRSMYDLGGGSSLFLSSPLQRRLRDAQAGTQHMMVGAATYELTGRVAMGLPTDATQL
ncbi:MAG TPA: acyl-CoA dehydrogenase family protein, partial [Stellaceae bacterium]|nr:acyl-CoA dehydrogenase family protein [Stellaceae bacterium]